MMTLEAQIQTAVSLIQQSNNLVVLTGAGISTPSGIPDFRDPDSGLWQQFNPMDVASIMAFRQHPTGFYRWARPLAEKIGVAQPNEAHTALAALERAGKVRAIITQNIDGLHQAAGSRYVLEVHGHCREVTCIQCFRNYNARPIFEQFMQDGEIPSCECGGVCKPNVVLFGEQLPLEVFHRAKSLVAEADLLLVAGSSLEVAPISEFPQQAHNQGTKIIINNFHPTYIDDQADLVFRQDLIDVLPKISNLVLTQQVPG